MPLALGSTPGNAQAQKATAWKIDKPHSFVNFTIGHMFSEVMGRFKDFEGEIYFDPNNLKGSSATLKVAVSSIETDTKQRNEHLKTADFFDAAKYPYITFKSEKIIKKSDKLFIVHGKLTIKDVTRHVELPMRITGQAESAMVKGVMVLGIDIETTINRSDYGVGVGQWALTTIVGDEVTLHIPMELNKPMEKK
jgi:polyisoprenoid-binding protein YceI